MRYYWYIYNKLVISSFKFLEGPAFYTLWIFEMGHVILLAVDQNLLHIHNYTDYTRNTQELFKNHYHPFCLVVLNWFCLFWGDGNISHEIPLLMYESDQTAALVHSKRGTWLNFAGSHLKVLGINI